MFDRFIRFLPVIRLLSHSNEPFSVSFPHALTQRELMETTSNVMLYDKRIYDVKMKVGYTSCDNCLHRHLMIFDIHILDCAFKGRTRGNLCDSQEKLEPDLSLHFHYTLIPLDKEKVIKNAVPSTPLLLHFPSERALSMQKVTLFPFVAHFTMGSVSILFNRKLITNVKEEKYLRSKMWKALVQRGRTRVSRAKWRCFEWKEKH